MAVSHGEPKAWSSHHSLTSGFLWVDGGALQLLQDPPQISLSETSLVAGPLLVLCSWALHRLCGTEDLALLVLIFLTGL